MIKAFHDMVQILNECLPYKDWKNETLDQIVTTYCEYVIDVEMTEMTYKDLVKEWRKA